MDPSRLLFQALSSIIPSGQITGSEMTGGQKTNTLSAWKNTIEQTGLATKRSGGKMEEWIPKIRSSICATLAELPTGSITFKARPMHQVYPGSFTYPLQNFSTKQRCIYRKSQVLIYSRNVPIQLRIYPPGHGHRFVLLLLLTVRNNVHA